VSADNARSEEHNDVMADAVENDDPVAEAEDIIAEDLPFEAIKEDIESLTVELEQAEAKAEEYLESLKRERASFQNYKKRVEQERTEQQRAVTGSVLFKLLPVLDDFHRAITAVPQDQRDEWYQGVALIQRKLEQFLATENVTEIEALGQVFDPNYHEAVGVDPEADAESGTITEVLQRGYKLGDRVLRPALVRVAG
jgi:molecular chaperone GrpE